jgi:hypothetical protein
VGGVFGALDRAGLDADFRARMRDVLCPGCSGLAFFAIDMDPLPALQQLGVEPTSALRVALAPELDEDLVWEAGRPR